MTLTALAQTQATETLEVFDGEDSRDLLHVVHGRRVEAEVDGYAALVVRLSEFLLGEGASVHCHSAEQEVSCGRVGADFLQVVARCSVDDLLVFLARAAGDRACEHYCNNGQEANAYQPPSSHSARLLQGAPRGRS